MLAPNGAGLASAATDNEALSLEVDGKDDTQTLSRKTSNAQAIRAELIGDNICIAGDITAQGFAPVLVMCQRLLAQGVDPDAALLVYRRGSLALSVRSIKEGAALKIAGDGVGFRRVRQPDAAPPVRLNGRALPIVGGA